MDRLSDIYYKIIVVFFPPYNIRSEAELQSAEFGHVSCRRRTHLDVAHAALPGSSVLMFTDVICFESNGSHFLEFFLLELRCHQLATESKQIIKSISG